ncbi:hypothetical protein CU098_013065, partial [Rhizopus stolonifer]
MLEYSEKNVQQCELEVDDKYELCYHPEVPGQPVLMRKERFLLQNDYCLYLSEIRLEDNKEQLLGKKRERVEIETDAQLVAYIEELYKCEDQHNEKMYIKQEITVEDVYTELCKSVAKVQ